MLDVSLGYSSQLTCHFVRWLGPQRDVMGLFVQISDYAADVVRRPQW